MIVYLLYMISPLIVEVIYRLIFPKARLEDKRTRHRYILLCGFVMFLMIGLRSYQNGSGDSRVYFELWKRTRGLSIEALFQIDMEKGFLFCVWILSKVFPAPQCVFLFSAGIFANAVSNFIEKYSDDACLAFMVFNCLGLFNFFVQGMRQAIAISICLYAVEFCKERRLLSFLGLVATAMLFHASAVVFLVVYPIWGIRMNFQNLVFAVFAAIIVFLSLDRIFSVINFLINDHYSIGNTELTAGGGFTMAIYIVCIVVGIRLAKNTERNVDLFTMISFFSYMTIISAVCFAMRYNVTTIMERVAYFFAFGEIVLISNSPKIIVKSQRKFVRLVVITLCFFVAVHKATYSDLIPYNFFW